ncbi:hypothetical protein Tco_0660869 [Tanacetum coccineum]
MGNKIQDANQKKHEGRKNTFYDPAKRQVEREDNRNSDGAKTNSTVQGNSRNSWKILLGEIQMLMRNLVVIVITRLEILGKLQQVNKAQASEVAQKAKIKWNSFTLSKQEVKKLQNQGVNIFDYIRIKIGNGDNTSFWKDKWHNESILKMFSSLMVEEFQLDNLSRLVSTITLSSAVDRQLAQKISSWWNVDYVDVSSYEEWYTWLISLRLQANLKAVFEGIFYCLWWSVWMFRNKILFEKDTPSQARIFDNIVSNSYYWFPTPSPEPPPEHRSTVAVNGGQRRSTSAVNGGQQWRTTVDHCRTTGQRWLTTSQRTGLDLGRVGSPRVANLVVPRGRRFIILTPGKPEDRT